MPVARPIRPKKRRVAAQRTRRWLKAAPKLGLRARPGSATGDALRDCSDGETALAEARKAHDRLHEAIDLLPQGIVFFDAEGRFVLWNRKYAEIYNATSHMFRPGARFEDIVRAGVAQECYPEAKGREEEWITERMAQFAKPTNRREVTLTDGRCLLIEERATKDGGVVGLRVDITELKQREASFRLLFESNPVPMIVCEIDTKRVVGVNEAALAHYGYPREKFEKLTIHDIQAFEPDLPWDGDQSIDERNARTWQHTKADGSLIDVAVYSRRLTFEERPAALLALMDITERKRAEAHLAFAAQHDNLTGLANRALLCRQLDDRLIHTRRNRKKVAVLFLNLDGFKAINDTLGHGIGDRVLVGVARRLQSVLREEDSIARLGSDEFAIVQSDVTRPEDAALLAERLLMTNSDPYVFDGHTVMCGASIGIAIGPGDGEDADKLLKNANMALSRAKSEGRGVFSFFEADMDARAQKRRHIEMELRAAIDDGALQAHYQPLIDLKSGRITGAEALVRWPHPVRGTVSPAEFIPVAEETGLINPIGNLMLRRACMDAASWPGDARVAVNLSPLQFRVGNLLAMVMDALKQSGLPPRRLELEITETLLLEKSDHVLATLHALRALGVRISMDDFGTGYSSLSYLRSFPFDKIKIDRSFVSDLAANHEAHAIVRSIISLGMSLGVTITAEGVETEAELGCLRAEGCHEAQGFLFSRARPNAEIVQLLAAQHAVLGSAQPAVMG
ncbi:MAG: EAL domain-containing protein [Rhizobiales bacterium]|nr:EAL domain-containing protein [Hyphomicrobiales bacterium]